MIEIKAYKPDCCNKAYMSKYSARRHEKNCWKNPDNHTCLTCKFYYSYRDSVCDYHFGEPCEHEYTRYGCEADRNNPIDIGYGEVKKHCKKWESKEAKTNG